MIIGTAGHIDHGKTALVHALTGVDTDRIPEEKQRGITIELGFAPLRTESDNVISIVDVPGHEGLVRTMVAGASGIDAALLVVSAEEGVMPQTREHMRVLTALDVRNGIVVLTKSDLIDAEWMSLVTEDVRSAIAGSSLSAAPIFAASARTGDGIDAVRYALQTMERSAAARPSQDLFRFVADRAFTLRGTGTVVTGTVWSGMLAVGEHVRLFPSGAVSRVRGIHTHGEQVQVAEPGRRCALALADITPDAAPHGTQIVTDETWTGTRILCADVDLVASTSELRPFGRDFMLYIAGSEARARVSPVVPTTASETLRTSLRVRMSLDRPVIARRGDRFVLRSPSPLDTVGGGVVVDPAPERGARGAWNAFAPEPQERLRALLGVAGGAGIETRALPIRLGIPPSAVPAAVAAADALTLGHSVFSLVALKHLAQDAKARVVRWCAAHPLDEGLPLAHLREELGVPIDAADWAVQRLCESHSYEVRDGLVTRPGEQLKLSDSDATLLARLLHRICDAAEQPPGVPELVVEFGARTEALLRFAARLGNLVAVESVRYYDAPVVSAQIDRLRGAMQPGREYSPQELRDILGVSRKYLIPFLEYCDRTGVTDRRPSGRTIRGISSR